MLVAQTAKDILMRTMYGSISQALVIPDALTVGSNKQTYKAPKFRPPATWWLGFGSVDPATGMTSLIDISVVPRLQLANTDASFTFTPEYVSNKTDLTWGPATGDSETGANYVLFYDANVNDPIIKQPTVWEGVPLPSLMYFSAGQRVTVNAGSLTIYMEIPQQQ